MRRLDIRSAVAIAFKYWRRAAMVFCGALLASVAVCVIMTTQYAATTDVLVKIDRELVYRPEVGSTQAAVPTVDRDNLIASNIAIMRGPDIERQVIKTIGAGNLYPKLVDRSLNPAIINWISDTIAAAETAVGIIPASVDMQVMDKFDRKLTIDTVKKTDIVSVSFMHPDPAIAARVANMVVDLFQQKTGSIYADPNLDFMQKNVDGQRAALTQAEARLNDFRRRSGVYAFNSQIDLLLKQRMDIDTGLLSAEAHIAELNGMVAALLVQRSTTPQMIPLYAETERHKSIDDAQTQLLGLSLQEQQLAGRFSDKYQPLIDIRSQIKVAKAALAADRGDTGSHTRRGLNDTYQEVNQETLRRQAELKSAVDRRDAMQAQLGVITGNISQLSVRQRELQDLEQDVALRTDAVKTSFDKLTEARVVDGLNRQKPASFSVVQAADAPDPSDPARPLPLLYTAAAAVVGMIGAASVVFFSYRMADTFVTPEQASRRLNMPVLAVISYNPAYKGKRSIRGSSGAEDLGLGQSIRQSGGGEMTAA